jgi:hypothetical protein
MALTGAGGSAGILPMKNKLLRWCAATAITFASAGWIFPLGAAANLFSTWIGTEAAPVVYGHAPMVNSFPLLHYSGVSFLVALLWMGISAFGWSFIGALKLLKPTNSA